MDFVGGEFPSDAVASMNPNLVWKKSQRLVSHVLALGAHGGLPGLRLGGLRKEKRNRKDGSTK
jgi:hypothetical protein